MLVGLEVFVLVLHMAGNAETRSTGSGFTRSGDTWTTPGFEQAIHKLRVELKAAMVGISVKWIEQ